MLISPSLIDCSRHHGRVGWDRSQFEFDELVVVVDRRARVGRARSFGSSRRAFCLDDGRSHFDGDDDEFGCALDDVLALVRAVLGRRHDFESIVEQRRRGALSTSSRAFEVDDDSESEESSELEEDSDDSDFVVLAASSGGAAR